MTSLVLSATFFSELVVFAAGNVTLIDVILHVDEKVRVSVIKKGYSTRCNVTIDGSHSPENYIVVHEQNILAGPIS